MAKIIDVDAYGKGLLSYLNGNRKAKYSVYSRTVATERWPIAVFFRSYDEMPELEKMALAHCRGDILDVGAGAGSHARYLQEQGQEVCAIDLSEGAIETMKRRGVKKVEQIDFFHLGQEKKYDTLLMLMNGIGIAQTLEKLPLFFEQCKSLLNKDGQVILDSSDLIYLFQDEEGEVLIDLNSSYYGEIEYRIDFANRQGEWFKWLFIDQATLTDMAAVHGFKTTILHEDDHYQYLAQLKLT